MRSTAALLEVGLIAVSAALAVIWLAIPDTTGFGKALSIALAVGWMVLFPWAQSAVLILLRRGRLRGVKAWRGALLLVGLGLVYWLAATFFDAGSLQDAERAQRWATHTWVWHVAGAATLESAQAAAWWLLRLLAAGVLLPFAIEGAARGFGAGWVRAGAVPLRRLLYWITLVGVAAAGTLATRSLLSPRTGLPVWLEVVLAIVTTAVVFVLDVGGLCLVLALTATYLRDWDRVARGGERLSGDRGGAEVRDGGRVGPRGARRVSRARRGRFLAG